MVIVEVRAYKSPMEIVLDDTENAGIVYRKTPNICQILNVSQIETFGLMYGNLVDIKSQKIQIIPMELVLDDSEKRMAAIA